MSCDHVLNVHIHEVCPYIVIIEETFAYTKCVVLSRQHRNTLELFIDEMEPYFNTALPLLCIDKSSPSSSSSAAAAVAAAATAAAAAAAAAS